MPARKPRAARRSEKLLPEVWGPDFARRTGIRLSLPISRLLIAHSARTIGEKLSVLSERSRKFHNLGIQCRLNVDVPTPATWQPVIGCREVRYYAEPGALHGTIRPRARVHFKQSAACHWYPHDFCGDYPVAFPKVDLGCRVVSWRVGAFVSRTPDGRKSSGVFSGTGLFARWANLGRPGSLHVSLGNKPQADLRRYPAKLRQLARRAAGTRSPED